MAKDDVKETMETTETTETTEEKKFEINSKKTYTNGQVCVKNAALSNGRVFCDTPYGRLSFSLAQFKKFHELEKDESCNAFTTKAYINNHGQVIVDIIISEDVTYRSWIKSGFIGYARTAVMKNGKELPEYRNIGITTVGADFGFDVTAAKAARKYTMLAMKDLPEFSAKAIKLAKEHFKEERQKAKETAKKIAAAKEATKEDAETTDKTPENLAKTTAENSKKPSKKVTKK